MKKKPERYLTVGSNNKNTPEIILTGNWLTDFGFHPDYRIKLEASENELILTPEKPHIMKHPYDFPKED